VETTTRADTTTTRADAGDRARAKVNLYIVCSVNQIWRYAISE